MSKILHSQVFGTGTPFLILHGFLGMSDNWRTLGKRFEASGFQMHLIDQRNHGRSFHSNTFNYKVMVEDLNKYCEYHQLENIILLGHSMGGKVAMEYATTYPNNLSHLIIADIGPKSYPLHHQIILEALSSLDFTKIKTRKEADKTLQKYISNTGIRLFLLKNLYWKSKEELGLRINLPILIKNIKEVGKALAPNAYFNKPTLFLRGENSGYIEDTDVILIKKHFPKASIKTIPKTGHWLHAENPNDFFEEVLGFLIS